LKYILTLKPDFLSTVGIPWGRIRRGEADGLDDVGDIHPRLHNVFQ
jgi:hypothetical protein